MEGRAMAQAVSRRPVTAEARVRSRVSPCRICGGQSGTGTGFFPEYFGCPLSVSFHRCSITWKHLHHRVPQGCGAPVASAAGPFSANRSEWNTMCNCVYRWGDADDKLTCCLHNSFLCYVGCRALPGCLLLSALQVRLVRPSKRWK
jgi:hypothetical protein